MARFKYMGEPPRGFVLTYGPATVFRRIPKKDGTFLVLTPIPPATHFPIGDDIGYDITDPRAIRFMSNDPRFQRIS